jgi:hypothetical protein
MDAVSAVAGSGSSKRRWRLPDHLPDLRGKWLTTYTILWVMMLAVAVVGTVRTQYQLSGFYEKPAWQPYGFAMSNNAGIQVAAVSSDEAQQAGVRAGDRIVAIDGWRVPPSASNSVARPHAVKPEGSRTTFTLAAPGKAPRDVRLTFARRHFEDFFARAGLSVTANEIMLIGGNLLGTFAFVASAILLFIRERKKAVPAFLSLSFLIVGQGWASDWRDLGIGYRVANTVDMAGWALLIGALFAFPTGRFAPRWTRGLVALLPPLSLVPLFTDSNLVILPSVGAFLLAAAAALIIRYRRLPTGAERQQLRWVFFGFLAGSAMLVLNIIGLLVSEQMQLTDARWNAWNVFAGLFGTVGVIFMALGLSISILRYRLYDADAVIGRSAAYGVLTLGFIALFAGTEKLAELIGERYFEHSVGIAAGAIGAAVAAACVVPLHNRVHRWAERRFQKPLIRLREGLPECVADLRESAPVGQLVEAAMKRVEAGVRSRCQAVLLIEKGKLTVAGTRGVAAKAVREWRAGWTPPVGEGVLSSNRGDPLFPLRVRLCVEASDAPETIGWLLLGPRPDGSFFGKDEREALEHVAGPVARAIHIAQLRERREAEAEERLTGLERLIAKLADALRPGSAGAAPA